MQQYFSLLNDGRKICYYYSNDQKKKNQACFWEFHDSTTELMHNVIYANKKKTKNMMEKMDEKMKVLPESIWSL